MKLTRRSMFWALAGGPLAAKAAAETAAAQLAGLSTGLAPMGDVPVPVKSFNFAPDRSDSTERATAAFFRATGIPDWLKAGWAEQARTVARIEPDIGALRSTSLAGKIAAQRVRNYERAEEQFWRNFLWQDRHDEQRRWREQAGVDFWW